jgi:predicted acetyltransferase
MQSNLTLRWPREDEEEEFMRAHRATSPDYPSFLHFYSEGMPFRRYLEVLAEQDHVAETFLFAFAGSRIVGRTAIRHSLNESLARVGGHIGYVVVPEFRRQGYATVILRLSLQIARTKCAGADHVLVTCDDDNVGSIRTIERNGGILESVVSGEDLKPKRRYWIEV